MKSHVKLALSLSALTAAVGAFYALPARDAIVRQLWGLNQAQYQEFAEKLKARKVPSLDGRFSLTLGDSLPPAPAAHPPGGRHAGPVEVTLSAPPTGRARRPHRETPVYYTLDGAVPTRRDRRYRGPIRIDTNAVLRFRSLPEDMLPGEVRTETYLVGEGGSLPALSIASDPVNLWNKHTGIYEHPLSTGRAWERQADLQYLRPGHPPVSLSGELRIHGGYSRRVPKKSFRFRFPVPRDLPLDSSHAFLSTAQRGENTVIIRAGGQAHSSRIRDALSALVFAGIGGHVSAFEPVSLFLNGAYWGVYDLRERIDEGYLVDRFGPGTYELLALDSDRPRIWGSAVVGDRKHWEKTLEFFRETSLADSAAYGRAQALLDVDNTFDYWFHNIYAANVDWPYNNFNAWRKADGPDNRWKWISWDVDGSFDDQGKGLDHNTLEWGLRDRVRNDLKWNYVPGAYEDREMYVVSTLFMRRLLENEGARTRFIARSLDLLNSAYRPEAVRPLFDSVKALAGAERLRDFRRWQWNDSAYRADMERVSGFIDQRPARLRGYYARYFGLGGEAPVEARTGGPGRMRINSLFPRDSAWTGTYLEGMTLEAEALPAEGAVFAGWEGAPSGQEQSPVLKLRLQGPLKLVATFRPSPDRPAVFSAK